MAQCTDCRRLYDADQSVEEILSEGMQPVAPPPDLLRRARRKVESGIARQSWRYRAWALRVAIPTAAAIVLLVMVLSPFQRGLHSIDDVVTHSMANHLDAAMTKEFRTASVVHAAPWLSERLGFAVNLPDLTGRGLTLIGGRKCRLGAVDAAYLFCDASGKRASLFLIDPDDVGFALTPGRQYTVSQDNQTITIWKESTVVCALVV
jgi:anti-sigma factor RsiW